MLKLIIEENQEKRDKYNKLGFFKELSIFSKNSFAIFLKIILLLIFLNKCSEIIIISKKSLITHKSSKNYEIMVI